MGGNKGPDIEKSPLLRSYKSHFIRMISQPLTRIMVVGYGFQDLHINEILVKGVDAGAKMFIVNTRWVYTASSVSIGLTIGQSVYTKNLPRACKGRPEESWRAHLVVITLNAQR